ncbi:MAG: acyl-ACP--UDP-N-acetylglucosamine O-acyltransferase [Gammaproteobacteria bacterium]|nr:acyl-ACP--UDP-N-acetylglucosamine O-acyltransferase [Gammaproteobacteria bacterium]
MIDERAIIDPSAKLASDVSVGPFSIIGPEVEIEAGTTIGPHVVIKGPTRIGKNNTIYQFSSIGEAPQDKKFAGEATRLEIGDNNTIREYVSINRGTGDGGGLTRIGNDNWIMAYVHIAHDCQVGNHTIFANNATLAGHVDVHDHAILGGFAAVHQFCRVGEHSFTAMATAINKDIPPFVMASGNLAKPHGLNMEGLKRRGFSDANIKNMRKAYKLLYKSGLPLEAALKQMNALASETPEVGIMVAFIEKSTRSIIR